MRKISVFALAFLCAAPALAAGEILLPQGSVPGFNELRPLDSFALPVNAFGGTGSVTEPVEGQVRQRTFRIANAAFNTLEIIGFFRDQLAGQGYATRLDCADADCGGFDFRFAIAVVASPQMEVNLTDFHALSAQKGSGADMQSVAIIVSKTTDAGFIQLTEVFPANHEILSSAPITVPATAADFTTTLETTGRVVLEGLVFASGKAELAADPLGILVQVANWLAENPEAQLILVGHTDNEGSLDSNIAMSKRRAGAVRDALVGQYGTGQDRLIVDGVGFLLPRALNGTEEGRALNRRVEIVLR